MTGGNEDRIQLITQTRLSNQQISSGRLADPVEVVRWLGAVQAQDFSGAKWALGLRLNEATDASIDDAFNQGRVLRTHVLRPTWHFVAPEDIRWMLELSAPRVNVAAGSLYRRLQLDDEVFRHSNAVIEDTLTDHEFLSRSDMADALRVNGLVNDNLDLATLLMRAELDGVICSGPRIGKQFTYSLLEKRVPRSRALDRDESLFELTRRYFTSHGPATARDFAWWSGLTTRDARRGIDMARSEFDRMQVDEIEYWLARGTQTSVFETRSVHLLPNYDEYIVGYRDRDAYWHESHDGAFISRGNPLFNNTVVVDGRIVGTWTRTVKKSSVDLNLSLFTTPDDETSTALTASIERYERFLELPLRII